VEARPTRLTKQLDRLGAATHPARFRHGVPTGDLQDRELVEDARERVVNCEASVWEGRREAPQGPDRCRLGRNDDERSRSDPDI
jgi:hypothetical protein